MVFVYLCQEKKTYLAIYTHIYIYIYIHTYLWVGEYIYIYRLSLLFSVVATSKGIASWAPICDRHSDFTVLPHGDPRPPEPGPNYCIVTVSWYSATSPYPVLLMLRVRLGSNKYQFCISLHRIQTHEPRHRKLTANISDYTVKSP